MDTNPVPSPDSYTDRLVRSVIDTLRGAICGLLTILICFAVLTLVWHVQTWSFIAVLILGVLVAWGITNADSERRLRQAEGRQH